MEIHHIYNQTGYWGWLEGNITKPEVFLVRLSHEQGLVEHSSVHHRVRLVQLGNHLVKPPHTVPGDGAHTRQVVLVAGNILSVPPTNEIKYEDCNEKILASYLVMVLKPSLT